MPADKLRLKTVDRNCKLDIHLYNYIIDFTFHSNLADTQSTRPAASESSAKGPWSQFYNLLLQQLIEKVRSFLKHIFLY